MSRRTMVWIASALLIVPGLTAGQERDPGKRAKVGVALSGGAARGLAHIGVLEWLEEHRIPVDYIAGTSMGGLVAAFYATGTSPAELREMVRNLDWDAALRPDPSYRNLSFRRKEDRRAYPNALEIGLREGVKLPIGLNGGHHIGLLLDRLALPYYNIRDFDELPIPFRCVATDIASAAQVVLKDGSLSEALRATMAIPGLFTPVDIGGRLLADGGVLNNLPVDVVREMGADVALAVQINLPPVNTDKIQSFIGMIDRSFDIMILQNENRSLRLADAAISLDFEKYTSTDYKQSDAIADFGYQGADRKSAILRSLSLDENAWQQHLAARRARRRTALPEIRFVEVAGTRGEATQAIARTLVKAIGKPVDQGSVESELSKITGWGRYDNLGYGMIRRGNQDGLAIRVREKLHGPPFINVGFEINGIDLDNIRFSLSSRLTVLDLGGYRSEWRTDASLGARTALSTEYYRPFRDQGWFVAPRAYLESVQSDIYLNKNRVAEYQISRSGGGLDLGYGFGRFSELRMGYDLAHSEASVRVGSPLLPTLSGSESTFSVRYTYDQQDSALVPRRGLGVRTKADWIIDSPGDTGAHPRAEMRLRFFHPLGRKESLFLGAAGGTTFGKQASVVEKFTLGGPLRLGALGLDEIRTDRYFYSAVGLLREIGQLPPLLGGKVYAAGWWEGGKVYLPDYEGYNHTGSAGVVVDTFMGPFFVGGSLSERDRGKLYFVLGRLF